MTENHALPPDFFPPLHASDSLLRGVLNTVPYGIITIDELGRIELFNPGAEAIFGYRADEVIGQPVTVLMSPEMADRHQAAFLISRTKETTRLASANRQLNGRRKDGIEVPLEISVTPMLLDGRKHYTAAVTDISTRLAIEHALNESQERYALAVSGINEGLWDWNVVTDEVYLSPQAHGILGIDFLTTGLTGAQLFTFVHPDDWPAYQQALIAHLKGEVDHFVCEFRLTTPPGRWIRQRGLGLRDSRGRVYRMAGSVGDITAAKNAEAALKDALDHAEAANRAKSYFLATMSHELRTPLNAIIGFAEIMAGLMGDSRQAAKYPEYAKDILDSARHLLSIINDILDMARIESGKVEIERLPVDIGHLAESALVLIRQRAGKIGLTLTTAIEPGLAPLRGDERRLKQALLNLLANAVKFTPAGGSVCVRAGRDPASGDVTIAVEDSGIGMAAEDIPRVLSPFTQLDNKLTRRYEGTGLGLPLAKAFVELHGGRLTIASTPGQGTTVSITFPADQLLAPQA
ncbi:MAG: PAS domain S-box protein [Rhodospirillales bacterium]|nr:PAS domain S-box protein [Rhodospirillales bacterium]